MAPAWLVPVVVMVALQTLASFNIRIIPVFYPAIAQEYGWQPGIVGYLSAATLAGGLMTLLLGGRLMVQLGGTRALQAGLLLAAVSMFLFHVSWLPVMLAACMLIGVSQGFAAPASSDVLQRYSPPKRRNLFFSIKQAGVPAGGVLAGLCIAPLVDYVGWRTGVAVAALFVVTVVLLTLRWREPTPPGRSESASRRAAAGQTRLAAFWTLVGKPLRSLKCHPGLPALCVIASLLASTQSIWFTFTVVYLVDHLGYSLALAGGVFAVMQAAGIFARIALGWLTDFVGSAMPVLLVCSILAAVSTALMALSDGQWPTWALFGVALLGGTTVSGWNGVHSAETARRSPPELVTSTAAGSSILITMANMAAPVLFALMAASTGSLALPWWLPVTTSLVATVLLVRLSRRERLTTAG